MPLACGDDSASGPIDLEADSGAVLTLQSEGDSVSGELMLSDGTAHTFTADPATGEAGLYLLATDDPETELAGGWIVANDGAQQGALLRANRFLTTPAPSRSRSR